MKKLLAGLSAILVIALVVITVVNYDGASSIFSQKAEAAQTSSAVEETQQEAAKALDYEAMRNAFAADEVVAEINGEEITWDTFCDWVAYYAKTVESNMQTYAMYGMTLNWDDAINDNGDTYASYAKTQAGNFMQQIFAIFNYCEENNIVVEDIDEQVAARRAEDMQSLGEDVTEEDFEKLLEEQHMSRAHYDQIMKFNIMYNEIATQTYGEEGELISGDEAIKYLTDNGYYAANHILFLTGDVQSEEAYDEATVAAALAKAEEITAELQAIEDKDELVKRFLELKVELDEDSGKTAYPNGYVFKLADMVPEFSDAVEASEDYQVTGPVQSTYGYHVIIRLPLDPDAVITGQQSSARQILAGESFSKLLEDMIAATNVELKPVLDNFTLADYIV